LRKLQFFLIICTLQPNGEEGEKTCYIRKRDVRNWSRVLFGKPEGRGKFGELDVEIKKIKWTFNKWIVNAFHRASVYLNGGPL
jgi:hypothetical protein